MSGFCPFDLAMPKHSLLTEPLTCPACKQAMASIAASFMPFRNRVNLPDPHAECRKRLAAERAAKAETALAEAATDWSMHREGYAGQPLILAVLGLHRPIASDTGPGCTECEQYDGMESTENVPWPCPTYAAIANPPEQADGEQPAEPDPRPLAPMEISLTVQHGLSNEQLHAAISDAIRRCGMYRPTRNL